MAQTQIPLSTVFFTAHAAGIQLSEHLQVNLTLSHVSKLNGKEGFHIFMTNTQIWLILWKP